MDETQQYLRSCRLIVSSVGGKGLDLSDLRIKFSVKRSDTETPNAADIRVYNLSEETALKIRKEFTKVVLEAGYQGNSGVIFQGNIKQVILGRESATDTFIEIVAGDGDRAYNFSIVNATIAKGSTQAAQVSAAVQAMTPKGVTAGHLGEMPPEQLPRGKAMYGNARNYLRNVAQTTQSAWSIQDGKVTFIKKKGYLPGTAVVLNSNTGMVGSPQQTSEGVNVKCLLNPNISPGGRVKLDEGSIQLQKLNLEQIASAQGDVSQINEQLPYGLSADGTYYVLVSNYTGDTRGVEWYCDLVCILTDPSANPRNAVQGAS